MTTRTLPKGVELVKADLIPDDNPDHGGEQAVHLRTASGAEAWGFGATADDAVSDAIAALANDL